jgi:hypothetical protein
MEAALRVTAKLPQHHSVSYHGIPVVIEWPKGSVREGKGKDGKTWRRTMNADYGFIDDTEAKGDEEPLDIYIASGDWSEGADSGNPKVYIIEQLDEHGDFDEYKLVAGVPDLETAQELYLSHYPKEWGQDRLGDCYEAALGSLRRKVEEHQDKTAALGRYLYHSTPATNILSIARKGLIPSDDPHWGGDLGADSQGKVFFADTPEKADYYGRIIFRETLLNGRPAGPPICLRILKKPKDLQLGEDESYSAMPIPPQDIAVFWHGEWQPISQVYAVDWEDMYYRLGEDGWEGPEGEPLGPKVDAVLEDAATSFDPPSQKRVPKFKRIDWPQKRSSKEEIMGNKADTSKPGTKLTGFCGDGPATCMDCTHRTPHSKDASGQLVDSCQHPKVMADPELQERKLPDGTIEVDADDWCQFRRKPQKKGGEEASGQEKPPRKASVGSIYMNVLGFMGQ